MMEYRAIPGVGKLVSRLVLGTMIITTDDLAASFDLLDAAWEQGYTTLDTAHVYGGGKSERAIGQWMKARENRDSVVLISKGCHHNADRLRVTPFDLASDLYDSLARLQTDYIDVYLLHRDDPSVPVGPMIESLNEHLRAGRIRAFGGSNWGHQRIAEANAWAGEHGLHPFIVSSPNYGLAEQMKDPWGPGCVTISGPANNPARAWYEANQMPVLAYSSLARGLFSGRVTGANFDEAKTGLDRACLTAYCHPPNFQRLERAIRLAEEKRATVPQIAVAYIFGSSLNVFPIVGAANEIELRENAEAPSIILSQAERAWLNLETDQR